MNNAIPMPPGVPQMPQRAQPSLSDTTAIECACGCNVFEELLMLRHLSRIVTGEKKDTVITVPILSCKKCHKPLEQMLPPELAEKAKIV